MFLKKKKYSKYSVVVYKEDLGVDINRILAPDKSSDVKEYVYVLHSDTPKEHYHIYLKYEKPVKEDAVNKLFYKSKCFISPVVGNESSLSLLCYFTENFRLPFESNYSTKIEELRRRNNK